ncbi:acylphosphatase [Desulfocastanea catecholica]
MKTTHVIVEGRVQGVCFRDYTCRQARQLNLCGWVRNRDDGTVEALFTGGESDVTAMLEWLWQGSPGSRVDAVRSRDVASEDASPTFEIRY